MQEIIKKYIEAANSIVISEMYLKKYPYKEELLIKDYNPGHLGTSTSLNFILGNLFYFLNKNKLTHQLIVGDAHAGVGLLANLWLNSKMST